MESRLLIDLDRDLPGLNTLSRLPGLLIGAGYAPVLQVGTRFPWTEEGRLRASWVYPEQALVGYADALREEGQPLEICLGRYGMIRGTEEINTFYGRFVSMMDEGSLDESEASSYALFLLGLLEDLRSLFGEVSRLFISFPGALPRETEERLYLALKSRVEAEGVEVVGLFEREFPLIGDVLRRSGDRRGAHRYEGSLEGERSEFLLGTIPLWCREELVSLFDEGEAATAWKRLSAAVGGIWELVRQGEELETALFIAAAAGDPAPLSEGVVLRRRLTEAMDELREAIAAARTPIGRLTEQSELLFIPARAAERAASRLQATLLPLRPLDGGITLSSSEDEARFDR
ncbi:MAG: hypothetical protein ACLFPP_05465 [Spirochaetaceae bacterium]